MKNMTKLAAGLLLLVLMLMPASPAFARGLGDASGDGRVIFGSDFVLHSDETLDGDLVVFGGNVTLETGSSVKGSVAVIGGNVEAEQDVSLNGDLVMIGGNLSMAGKLNGNVVMIGGHLSLDDTAVVKGDISTVGGSIDRAPGAQVSGQVIDDATTPTITIPDIPSINVPQPPSVQAPTVVQPSIPHYNPFSGFFGGMGWAILVALAAVVASLFLHPQLDRVSSAIFSQPLMAGSFGLLASTVSVVAVAIMAVTLILLPVSILTAMAFGLVWLFGLVAIGQEVGDRLARQLNQVWAVPLSAGLGTLLLMLVVGLMVALIPCVGVMSGLLVGMVGLGGVLLTYFGSRNYPIPEPLPVEVPPAS